MVRTTRRSRYRDMVQKSSGQGEVCAALVQAVEQCQEVLLFDDHVRAVLGPVPIHCTIWAYAPPPAHLSMHMPFSSRFWV